MTSISNTTSNLCLINPGVCVCVGGGGGGLQRILLFFHSCIVTVNSDQNEQMLWPN